MIYPIVAYGDPVLRKKCDAIAADYPQLPQLIEDMFKTMYHCEGCGLAAPQVGLDIRLFVVDADPFKEDDPGSEGFKKAFINAEIISRSKEKWRRSEGCLSIPGIYGEIERPNSIVIRYHDLNFVQHTEEYTGIKARIIQHEYDHIEGVLTVDHFTPLKKSMLKGKLNELMKGRADAHYRMKFSTTR
ncbi:MAG: peptide deformylase [Sphingobacteriales bacterium]|jgi:peptide deformylase|nr:peptide deformylase [Sphingobacteriales bacterium]